MDRKATPKRALRAPIDLNLLHSAPRKLATLKFSFFKQKKHYTEQQQGIQTLLLSLSPSHGPQYQNPQTHKIKITNPDPTPLQHHPQIPNSTHQTPNSQQQQQQQLSLRHSLSLSADARKTLHRAPLRSLTCSSPQGTKHLGSFFWFEIMCKLSMCVRMWIWWVLRNCRARQQNWHCRLRSMRRGGGRLRWARRAMHVPAHKHRVSTGYLPDMSFC